MTEERKLVVINRDVDALMIPSGARIYLQAGTEVTITQALGGSYTVNIYGNLARIDAKDADALGMSSEEKVPEDLMENHTLDEVVWIQLKKVYDPEIPVNIADLGLIYSAEVIPLGKGDNLIKVTMTLTAPGCGMGPTIVSDVQRKLMAIPSVTEAKVDMVFDPPWSREMMSEEAKLELGLL